LTFLAGAALFFTGLAGLTTVFDFLATFTFGFDCFAFFAVVFVEIGLIDDTTLCLKTAL
jgi:hypothetical protein